MCSLFQWKLQKIEELVRLDKCRKKFGSAFWSAIGKDPRMEPVYILFPYLTKGEQQMIVNLLRLIAEAGTKESNIGLDAAKQPVAEL